MSFVGRDITVSIDGQTFAGGISLFGGDLAQAQAAGDELVTALYVSLFTTRGWWADAYEPDPWGSLLLTLRRAKRTQGTLNRARDYCRQALAWLIEDGVARTVNVVTEWQGPASGTLLAIGITVIRPRGLRTRYDFVWTGV